MALTGACLVLFVTFHCVMNAIAICWPAAYNVICEFLGANWYALAASMGLALLFIIHIIYALWLTLQNRRARGNNRYLLSKRPADVEWSSKNMLVLGIVVLAFLAVHLIQFWAKMQLQEIRGLHGAIPPTAGTLFIQEAFGNSWTLIVYGVGFLALWFHMNHGFWSMFQSVGWNNAIWIPRLRKIGLWWTSIVILLFFAEGIVFTVKAHQNFYKEDAQLRSQYVSMIVGELGIPASAADAPFEDFAHSIRQTADAWAAYPDAYRQMIRQQNPGIDKEAAKYTEAAALMDYLEGIAPGSRKPTVDAAQLEQQLMMQQQMMMQQSAPAGAEVTEEVTEEVSEQNNDSTVNP